MRYSLVDPPFGESSLALWASAARAPSTPLNVEMLVPVVRPWFAYSKMSRRCLYTAASSFMARAKAGNDASVLLGPFTSAGRFDACLERAGMHCLAIGDGDVVCDLTVNDELSNNYGEQRLSPPP